MRGRKIHHTASKRRIVVIVGPTASGKTTLAQALCRKFSGFIISADSRQVYRYLDIGTGKVENIEEIQQLNRQRQVLLKEKKLLPFDYCLKLNQVNHYMIDFVEPLVDYNVALYQRDVTRLLDIKKDTAQTPFIVGGTGLYLESMVDNWQFPVGVPDLKLRQELEHQATTQGLGAMWRKLIRLDPQCQAIVQKQNSRRVIRALEYVLSTGCQFSTARRKGVRKFNFLKIGIQRSREELYHHIDRRVAEQIRIGLIEEVEQLHHQYQVTWQRLQNFGLEYRVAAHYLMGKFNSLEAMSQRLKWDIHAYARRQLTWFRRDSQISWISHDPAAEELVNQFISKSGVSGC